MVVWVGQEAALLARGWLLGSTVQCVLQTWWLRLEELPGGGGGWHGGRVTRISYAMDTTARNNNGQIAQLDCNGQTAATLQGSLRG